MKVSYGHCRNRRILLFLGAALLLQLQHAGWAEPSAAPREAWTAGWTVLTIAPDGSWGVATAQGVGQAIARAVSNCRKAYGLELGCGHQLTTIQAGWSLAFRCGEENIIVAAQQLREAEALAARREAELRAVYVPSMPRCRRVVTIDPRGESTYTMETAGSPLP